jgi:hypothetical protein
MQNERSFDVAPGSPAQPGSTASSSPPPAIPVRVAPPPQSTPIPPRASPYISLSTAKRSLWRFVVIGICIVLVLVGGIIAIITQMGRRQSVQSGEYNVLKVPLGSLASNTIPIENATSLKINGQLEVSGSILLSPSSQPKNPFAGQLYFDQTSSKLTYYDGQQFVSVGSNSASTGGAGASTTSITNVLAGSGASQTGVELQGASPGTPQTGNFNISGVGQVGTLKTSVIATNGQAGGAVSVQANNFSVQSTSGQNFITADASAGSLALAGVATGEVTVSTGANVGVTGNISIKTGDSSTTASGDITIDAGSGVVSGTVVGTKTFESGTDNVVNWFGATVAQTSAQAHTGTHSLQMTATNSFWGIQEDTNHTLVSVTPGHNYHFSFWVRAATASRSVSSHVVWVGGASTIALQTVVDSTTGWTEVTGNGIAPAGATKMYFTAQSSGSAVGEVHYFDDYEVTDLSSSSATSVLHLGDTNAQIVSLGNFNQIGATTIRGGSGIDIQSGASGITMNGGAVSITGNAASSLSTTGGALTLSSAATASWGVSTAATGIGGDLTLHAGNGSSGNNDGGDLILQGGNGSGTGIGGSVVVRPQSNATDVFQVQNSAGTSLLVADTTGMKISVTGTTTTFASLTLANAHFASTQTSPPTISTPTNCGTTPTATVVAGSTDTAGSFTITTGTGGTSSTCDTIFTFNKPYGAAPKSIIVVGRTDAASAARQAYVVSSNATTFTLSFGNSVAGANSTAYSFSYWVVE